MEEGIKVKMILIVDVCSERLHYYEFVKPLEDVLIKKGFDFESLHYGKLDEEILGRCDKVIICGTSLRDEGFLWDLEMFSWLKDFEKPVLGVCAGMQILGMVFGGKLKKFSEIGFFHENFEREFLGIRGKVEVYHLHNNYVEFGNEFEVFAGRGFAQAVKSKDGELYGVLFHPEVRNRKMILGFCRDGFE